MRHLFNALKEHWQIYLGLFLGLVIGLLVGVGFADWKSLVKAFDFKVTDWISSLSTLIIMCFTAVGVMSWKKQKTPDLKSKVAKNIIDFDTHAVLLPSKKFQSIDEIKEYNAIHLKIFWDIEHSLSTLYMFDKSNKQEIDTILGSLLQDINSATSLIEKHARYDEVGRSQLVRLINNRYKNTHPNTTKLFELVVGKSNVVGLNGSS